MRRLGNRGDTIVEVLIVIVVVAMVIASSYAVATRSQKTNQQTQEHAQALKNVESQLENLKSYAADNDPSGLTKFCFTDDGALVQGFGASVPAASAGADNLSAYPAGCKKPLVGTACTNVCYSVAIVKGNGADTDLYTATARWDGITGNKDEVKLVYRLHYNE